MVKIGLLSLLILWGCSADQESWVYIGLPHSKHYSSQNIHLLTADGFFIGLMDTVARYELGDNFIKFMPVSPPDSMLSIYRNISGLYHVKRSGDSLLINWQVDGVMPVLFVRERGINI